MSVKHGNGGLLGRTRYGGLLEAGRRIRPTGNGGMDDSDEHSGKFNRCLGGESLAARLRRECPAVTISDEELEAQEFLDYLNHGYK